MTEIRAFLLPDLGEGLTESEVVNWRVAVGDTVTLNQIIAEVETAKAIVELPAPYAGIITRIYAEPGVTVNVGEPLIDFEVPDAAGNVTANGDAPTAPIAQAPAEPQAPNLVGYGAPPESGDGPARRARRRLETQAIPIVLAQNAGEDAAGGIVPGATGQTGPVGTTTGGMAERARSTPPVRKLAHDLGIDLEQLQGSGTGGTVTRDDVEAAFAERFGGGVATSATQASPATAAPTAAPVAATQATARASAPGPDEHGETRIPIHGVRKHTAAAMVQSAFTAPHVSCFLTVDVGRSVELLAELRAERSAGGPKIGILALVAQAVCLAARRTPELNSHWDEAAQQIVQYRSVHLGIAAATPRGLIVPVISDAQAMGLAELADAIAGLSEAARAGTTTPQALRGGTFSISNIGVFGVDAGTPILNPGEAGILAIGALRREPREWQGEIALRDVLTLSLSFDHRVVDGEQGARFLRDVGMILNNPGRVLSML
ncbi:pyruvate dehydrogenase E2 component (dihydrolipoamide acetyltransferase) [Microterricola gilva]|uniref:Dihydrolipoamide acetyltransferase component of pyruvate dehydrogenase complex n=1 Tax=Microterricola gilva TaxID=393267 RepID=A0A4Q8AMF6_9MICO|nr:dihydrolipoamide acetyltransferase family protein [Microterricola gilva]RZU65770.1 pyruvate dehydrogenase E2 component (dihydrolipoamide acetyltransferase) [Microterricola gilva]